MTADLAPGLTHGTAVALNGAGLLILGPPGSGKSGLALEMMARGAELVGDDQVVLEHGPDGPVATAPANLSGKIEARFLGILESVYTTSCILTAAVDLSVEETNRLPPQRNISIGTQQIDLIYGANVPNLASALIVMLRGCRIRE